MTRHYLLEHALIGDEWRRAVLLTVDDDGRIASIHDGAAGLGGAASAEHVAGFVVPGMANAHSHAFQRGMAGSAEFRLSARDSFWTWRQAMYALANRVTPADLEIIATQLFVEMLKAGYTSVAEFHYLHRAPDGSFYADGTGLWEAVLRAAEITGIGLTLLPTLYQTSDFGGAALRADQIRFGLDTDWFVRAIERRIDVERRTAAATLRTGAAFHSLRAVPLDHLREATAALRGIDAHMPLHIHVAEQTQEVDACRTHTGRRPIELLLDTGLLDRHWCLVHATHALPTELAGIAASQAVVCVSISTEGNLGDGFFDTARFLSAGGRLCVGSDSQSTVDPAEELRWMEYQMRLRKRRRAVLAAKAQPHVGMRLWRAAAQAGHEAIGQPAGTLAVGQRADFVALEGDHPTMGGCTPQAALDHLLFAGGHAAIRDVMVAGRWVVRDGHHASEMPLRAPFNDLMRRLREG